MIITLITVGIACLLAAIIGGGFTGLGVTIPVLHSRNRQIMLAMAGAVLLGSGAAEYYWQQWGLTDPDKELTTGLDLYDQGNFTDALPHLAKAAGRGKHEAEWHYGEMLFHGEGCVPDQKKAIHWIRRAAESGYAPAEASLGIALALGEGVGKDVAQGKLWADRSASQGDPWGLMVAAEFETDSSKKLAALYKSATSGYAPAQTALAGLIVQQLKAGAQTVTPAELLHSPDLLKRAAEQGEPNAQLTLAGMQSGLVLAKGQGPYTPEDLKLLEDAYSWVVAALEQNDHRFPLTEEERIDGIELRKKIEQALPVEDQLQVMTFAKSWKPTPNFPYRHGHE